MASVAVVAPGDYEVSTVTPRSSRRRASFNFEQRKDPRQRVVQLLWAADFPTTTPPHQAPPATREQFEALMVLVERVVSSIPIIEKRPAYPVTMADEIAMWSAE